MKATRPLLTEDEVVFEKLTVTSATAKTALVFRRSSIIFNQFTSFGNFQKGEVY